MRKISILLMVFLSVVNSQLGATEISSFSDSTRVNFYPVRERMLTKSLNGTWKFKFLEGLSIPAEYTGWEKPEFDVSRWDNIIVPGNWETQGFKKPEYRWIAECVGLYRTQFKYDPEWKGKHVILRLDGVHFGYECYLNGVKVGEWGSAHNLCQFDVTPYLHAEGNNVLSVKVTTRAMGWEFDKNDCWVIAGITRDVELFSLENIYLEDVTFASEITTEMDASVKVNVDVNRFAADGREYRLNVAVSDPLNNHVLDFSQPITPDVKTYTFEGFVKNPKLWTAETPNLYRMEVFITNEKGIVVQRANERVGMRSIYVDGFDLKVNHAPVLLRGMCVNEIDPKLGRALTYKERRKQLEQMKEANINFIRTAHYPFGPDFLNLCDEMGFYVADEVPFGHGDQFLDNKAYQPELIARAEATLRRDKNHPSVIIWTIGNENPYTKVVEEVIKYVKEKDPTRPRGLPQRGTTFTSLINKQSKNVDIYMGHYLSDARIQVLIDKSDKPVIMTEYAHSLGLAFNDLENKYNRILTEPKIIGGAIWDWQDQGLLTDGSVTKQDEKQLGEVDGAFSLPINSKVTQGVWVDSLRYLDTFADQGTDGVVYADGYPQEDFYVVRKVYSPVVVLTDVLNANVASSADLIVEMENRFDFISLHGYKMNWSLKNLNNTVDKGILWLQTDARKRESLTLKAHLPENIEYNDLMLCLEIQDPIGKAIYEKNIDVNLEGHRKDYHSVITSIPANKKFSGRTVKGIIAKIGEMQYQLSNNGIFTITGEDRSKIAETPLYLRVGRKTTITPEYHALKTRYFWDPYILTPEIDKIETSKQKDGVEAKVTCKWRRGEDPKQYISGIVTVKMTNNGLVQFDYTLTPSTNAENTLIEVGLTLKFAPSFDTFCWLGSGPFTTTPDKNAFNERGIWKLHRNDLRFIGNRGKVDIAALTNHQVGIGLWSGNGNFGVENIDDSVYVTQNINVVSYGNKFASPSGRIKANELGTLKGTFILFSGQPVQGVDVLAPIFKPYQTVVPEQPYLKSYGW